MNESLYEVLLMNLSLSEPCKLTSEIYIEYNIKPVPYDYIQHSDREIKLQCKRGWNTGGLKRSDYVMATCSYEKITINTKCEYMLVYFTHS